MALYFKCPKCGHYFIDRFGEHAQDDSQECFMNGPYVCPDCDTVAEGISIEEYQSRASKPNVQDKFDNDLKTV